MSDRYVVAGLARARTEWFRRVGRWATEASIPVEFVRCVSVAELRARLGAGRPFSAVLLGSDAQGVDRDVLALAREVNAAPVVVADDVPRDWLQLGAAVVLPSDFDRRALLEALTSVAHPVRDLDLRGVDDEPDEPRGRLGRLVAVTGPGGTGASTVAMAAAQGLAAGDHGSVLLADLRRMAEMAMLHDAQVVVPGLQELVDAHRGVDPPASTVVDGTFSVPARGYRLLLGLRRPQQWTTLRPRALEAAISGMRRAFDVTVADVDPDVEGEDETGSVDVEERHLASRLTLGRADAVLVVGAPSAKGLYSLARLLGDLLAFGVPPQRIVTVLNRAPRSVRQRAELTQALGGLLDGQLGGRELATPVHLPERKVEQAVHDGVALPDPLPTDVADTVAALLARPRAAEARQPAPVPVAPGSLGLVHDDVDAHAPSHDGEEDVA